MSPNVATIEENETVRRAANVMRGRSIGSLVVLRGGRLAGIVTVSDLLDLLGKGGDRRAQPARASLHYRVPHRKQHRGRSW
jgi:CBS domain-containing protein